MTESIETTEAEALDCAEIDERLELVLRAAGSSLRHYTMAKTLADLRAAMRTAMAPPATTPERTAMNTEELNSIAGDSSRTKAIQQSDRPSRRGGPSR